MSAGSTPSMKTTLIFSAPLRLCVKLFSKELLYEKSIYAHSLFSG